MYEDDGITSYHRSGAYAKQLLTCDAPTSGTGNITLTIGSNNGSYSGKPSSRTNTAQFHHTGDVAVSTTQAHSGSYSLRIRSIGYTSRDVNLSGQSGVNVTLWWNASSFEAGDYAEIQNSDRSVIQTIQDGADDGAWHYSQFNYSQYDGQTDIYLKVQGAMSSTADYLYIDDVAFGGSTPVPTATPSGTAVPTPVPTPTPGGGNGTTWTTGVSYNVGDVVTYNGVSYSCRQLHTSIVGWEPPNAASLWLQL